MRLHATALGILVALGGISCAGSGGSGGGKENSTTQPVAQAHEQALAAVAQAKAKSQQAEMPSIPKDAQYTIYCATISTPDHASRIKLLKSQLMQTTKLRDWYIMHGEGQSTLYYGFYREDQEARMHEDCRAVAGVMTTTGERMFMGALPMPLETIDATAPAEWNLLNAKGVYTLQIAMYRDNPQRKTYAVEAVREARAAGYEAYYYHGANASLVCIGSWPESAVDEQDEVRAENPNEVVGVAPAGLTVQGGVTADGRPIRVVQPKSEIKDPRLLASMKTFPNHSINGLEAPKVKNPLTGQVRTVNDPSVVVRIPRKGAELGVPMAGGAGPNAEPAGPSATRSPSGPPKLISPSNSPAQGGKLKSLGDSK
jgi:hypothetical protein